MCTDQVIRNTYQKSPCQKQLQCQDKETIDEFSFVQDTEEQEEETGAAKPKFTVLKSNKGTFNSPQKNLMTSLKTFMPEEKITERV